MQLLWTVLRKRYRRIFQGEVIVLFENVDKNTEQAVEWPAMSDQEFVIPWENDVNQGDYQVVSVEWGMAW